MSPSPSSPTDPGEIYRAARPGLDNALELYRSEVERLLLSKVPDHYVVGRVKSARSLIRKLRKKPASPRSWDSITDKVGVRVICSTRSDCRKADSLLRSGPWDEIEHEVKSGEYDRLFYPGIHLIVCSTSTADHRGSPIPCEIQIRTRAQDAWAVISHKLSYKGAVQPPKKMKRLIDRLTVVVEMFDDEVHRLFKKRSRLPMYRTAVALEHLEDRYEGLTGDPAEGALDLSIIAALLEAYSEEDKPHFETLVDTFCETRVDLAQLISDHSASSETYQDSRDWLFTQPEVLAVLERASNRPYLLLAAIGETDLEEIVRRVCVSANLVLPQAE